MGESDHSEQILDQILDQIPCPMWCKDAKLNYVFANKRMYQLTKLKSIDIINRNDYELPWDIYAESYRDADKIVITSGKPLAILHPVKLGNNDEITIISRKNLIKDNSGNISGVLGLITVVANKKIIDSSKILNHVDTELIGHDINYYFFECDINKFNLTSREKECLFFLIRGKTTKEVSNILAISPRTVETHIEHIKIKFNCSKKSDLISKAIENGYFHIIPDTIPLEKLGDVFSG